NESTEFFDRDIVWHSRDQVLLQQLLSRRAEEPGKPARLARGLGFPADSCSELHHLVATALLGLIQSPVGSTEHRLRCVSGLQLSDAKAGGNGFSTKRSLRHSFLLHADL